MKELLDASMSAINIIPTVLLVLVFIYWIIVILGVIDVETVDFDLDVDVDVDMDLDVDADIDADSDVHVSGDGLTSVLSFFNIGHMPFMIFLSFLSLPLWIISVTANSFLGNSSFLISLILLIPNLIVSLFIAKFLTTPIARFYMKLKREDEAVNPLGKVCKVLLTVKKDSMGQAEIMVDGTSILISAITRGEDEIKKGETALVIDFDKEGNHYIIEPYKN